MKAIATASVLALIAFLIGLDISLHRKQRHFEEEKAKAEQEEWTLSHRKQTIDTDVRDLHDLLRRVQQ